MTAKTITMPCPHCHISLHIAAEHLNQTGRCKHCQGQIVVYDPEVPDTKQCAFCKETVHKKATTCKHCGANIGVAYNLAKLGGSITLLGCLLPFLALWVMFVMTILFSGC